MAKMQKKWTHPRKKMRGGRWRAVSRRWMAVAAASGRQGRSVADGGEWEAWVILGKWREVVNWYIGCWGWFEILESEGGQKGSSGIRDCRLKLLFFLRKIKLFKNSLKKHKILRNWVSRQNLYLSFFQTVDFKYIFFLKKLHFSFSYSESVLQHC